MAETIQHPDSSHVLTIEYGDISGKTLTDGCRAFLGVPYAAPPVGNLRWRPPVSHPPWNSTRVCEDFGPSSAQFPPPANSIYSGGETSFDEDCLYLNIWTGATDSTNRPVLVWFHFGAFMFGSGANPIYDGAKLATAGMTVLTVNYRLGRMGFLAHPELTAEAANGTSGNYGIMDQIFALQWVQRNISTFGGDPSNVTVGGASAGGASIHILRASPLARGLFSKAIVESAAGVTPTISGHGHVAAYTDLSSAEAAGLELMEALGARSVQEMRALPPTTIMQKFLPRAQGKWRNNLWPGSVSLSLFDTANPIVDGYVVPESPLTALMNGKVMDVPLLTGNVGNEGSGLPYLSKPADLHDYIVQEFGGLAGEIMDAIPVQNDAEATRVSRFLLAQQVFVWPTWTAARLQASKLRSPVWYYRIERAPPVPDDMIEKPYAGAFHCCGLLYGFGNLDSCAWSWASEDRALCHAMMSAWISFMQHGRPDCSPTRQWLPLSDIPGSIKIFDQGERMEQYDGSSNKICGILDKYYRFRNV